MMIKSRFFIIVSLAVVLIGCKKDPIQYKFSGTITDNVSANYIEGVDVIIKQLEVNNSVTTTVFTSAGSDITDSQGHYEMTFERKKVSEFKMTITKDGFFKKEISISAGDVSSENENVLNYELDAKSVINFDIENTGLSDPGDEFLIILYNYRLGCEGCASVDYNYFNGIVDTNFQVSTTAGGYFKFTYSQIGVNSYTDSVYLPPFDTVNYAIDYWLLAIYRIIPDFTFMPNSLN